MPVVIISVHGTHPPIFWAGPSTMLRREALPVFESFWKRPGRFVSWKIALFSFILFPFIFFHFPFHFMNFLLTRELFNFLSNSWKKINSRTFFSNLQTFFVFVNLLKIQISEPFLNPWTFLKFMNIVLRFRNILKCIIMNFYQIRELFSNLWPFFESMNFFQIQNHKLISISWTFFGVMNLFKYVIFFQKVNYAWAAWWTTGYSGPSLREFASSNSVSRTFFDV